MAKTDIQGKAVVNEPFNLYYSHQPSEGTGKTSPPDYRASLRPPPSPKLYRSSLLVMSLSSEGISKASRNEIYNRIEINIDVIIRRFGNEGKVGRQRKRGDSQIRVVRVSCIASARLS